MKQNYMIAIVLIAALLGAIYFGVITVNTPNGGLNIGQPTPTPTQIPGGGLNGVFAGNLKVSTSWINHGNLDVATTHNATVKILHADGSLFGTTSVGAAITGQVKTSDNGLLQVILTPASTAYIDKDWTVSQNTGLITSVSPTVVSGVTVYKFTLNVANQAPLGAGETSRDITLIIGEYVADVSGLGWTSVVNGTASTFSGTTYVATSATGYISGLTQTDAFKITKVSLSMPDAANITMYDDGKVKNLQVVIGLGNGQTPLYINTWTHNMGETYIVANIGVADSSQEYYGIPVVYGVQDAATAINYAINVQCANFAASAVWEPTLVINYVGPDGTPGSFSEAVDFTDS